MKQILIVSHAMELGGAERSLLGLLNVLDPKRYKIDLFLLRHEGELLEYIPEYVHVLPKVAAYTVLARPMKDTLREGHFWLTGVRLYAKIKAARYNKKHQYKDSAVALEYSHKYIKRYMPKINPTVEYDLAISFLTPHYFVAEKVRAKKKIAWIHTDYKKVQINIPSETVMWGKYDYIASISEEVSKSFLEVCPSLRSKLILIENILPERLIKRQAMELDVTKEMPVIEDGFRLLSIGRYCTAKNFDNVPAICSCLLKKGFKVKWYIIGFGGDEELIRQKIAAAKMEEYVILLGKKENPYPYIKACDLYVQPSRYEGKSVTVREAQMFAKPVVITAYPTSGSQLEDGVDGVVVPMDNEGCADGIAKLLDDPKKMQSLSEACRRRDYSNQKEVEKLYELLN